MFLANCLLFGFLIKLVAAMGFFGNVHVNVISQITPAKMKCFGFGVSLVSGAGYNSPDDCGEYKEEMRNAVHSGFRNVFGKHKLFWKKHLSPPPPPPPIDENIPPLIENIPPIDINPGIRTEIPMETTSPNTYTYRYTRTNTIPEPRETFTPKLTKNCGKSMITATSRVIGGQRAQEMEYPWQIGIQKIDKDIDDRTIYHIRGGGAIINRRWILTAAHVFNDITLNQTRGIYGTISSVNPRKTIKFDKLIIHKDFNMKTFMNDIALLRVEHDMELFPNDKTVNAVCLPEKHKTYDEMVTVTGWGITDPDQHSQSPEFLMSVGLKIVDNSICSKLYPTFNATVMLCAGEPDGGKDSCDGDSGGPLIVYKEKRGIVIGVVSFGQPRSCGKKDTAAAYTKVSHFVDWITATVNNKSNHRNVFNYDR